VSHLKEELNELRIEYDNTVDESHKYLDIIIRQSLASGKYKENDVDLKWLRKHIMKNRKSVFITQQGERLEKASVSPSNLDLSISPFQLDTSKLSIT
jgi:hypothetical protein